jgi:hypothetical protein
MIHTIDTTDIFNMTISLIHLAMYKKDEEGLIVIVAAQNIERTRRNERFYDLFVPRSASPTPKK